ncbi:MAG TPA: pilus assembly protein PilM [Verrucomicrobiae bacterium]|jgi:type IV pilus assembly protein PilM
MTRLESKNSASLFAEIGQGLFQAVLGSDAFSFPLEREENGRLTDLCRQRLVASLRGFLSQKSRAPGRDAVCAIGARGVSLRHLTLPAASEDEFKRVLRLQIESEFPISPDQLAWGIRRIGPPKTPSAGGAPRQEVLVVAVKKEVLEEYAGVFAECGITSSSFTLAALARAEIYPPPSGSGAVLDIGRVCSELAIFEDGAPASIRVLAWGGENITQAIQQQLSVSRDEAEKLKRSPDAPGPLLKAATESALLPLAKMLQSSAAGAQLYLTGKSALDPQLAPLLSGLLGGAIACRSLEQASAAGPSAALAGLMKPASFPLLLQSGAEQKPPKPARPAVWKWAAAAALLALAAIAFPYAQAMVMKPFLEKRLAALESDRGRLAMIDEEVDFLQFLKQNQPPYLDTIYLLARSAPDGTQVENFQMGRHSDISLRLKFGNTQQVGDFRSKLIDSGWFANVIVEEQAPSPDRRIAVRMTATLKPAEARKPIPPELPGQKRDRSGPSPWSNFGQPPPQMMPSPPPAAAPSAAPAPAPPPNMPDNGLPRIRRRGPPRAIINP